MGLTGHRDHVATACPGDAGYARLDDMRDPFDGSGDEEATMFKRLEQGARGDEVEYVQRTVNQAGADPQLATDGVYGPRTTNGIAQVTGSDGSRVTPWRMVQIERAAARAWAGGSSDPVPEGVDARLPLTRIDGSRTVYQIVGYRMVALTDPGQAAAIASLVGWGEDWWSHVGDLTADEVAEAGFTVVEPAKQG